MDLKNNTIDVETMFKHDNEVEYIMLNESISEFQQYINNNLDTSDTIYAIGIEKSIQYNKVKFFKYIIKQPFEYNIVWADLIEKSIIHALMNNYDDIIKSIITSERDNQFISKYTQKSFSSLFLTRLINALENNDINRTNLILESSKEMIVTVNLQHIIMKDNLISFKHFFEVKDKFNISDDIAIPMLHPDIFSAIDRFQSYNIAAYLIENNPENNSFKNTSLKDFAQKIKDSLNLYYDLNTDLNTGNLSNNTKVKI